jgi:predicted TIM-barrel fold metal-dependent hydrolase
MYPTIPFVMDHFGSPIEITSPGAYATWLSDTTKLSKLPNVYAKISGLMPVLGLNVARKKDAKWIAASSFGDMVRDTVRLFGAQRCMFGYVLNPIPIAFESRLTRPFVAARTFR